MSSKPVILIICNRVPYPLKDGGALAMYAMIKGWHEAGNSVYVLAMNTSRHKVAEGDLPPLFRDIAGFEMVEMDTAIHLLPVLTNFVFSSKPQHAARFYSAVFAAKISAALKKVQPDVVQLESIYLQEYAGLIRRFSKALLLHRLHNIEAQVWQRLAGRTENTVKKVYLKNLAARIDRYEREVWNNCDGIMPISAADAAHIRNIGCSTPAVTIPYGINRGAEPVVIDKTGDWTAYHIGAMDWQPNVEAMEWMHQELVPEIIKQTPDFLFRFAGRNMPAQFLQYRRPEFFCSGEVNDAAAFIEDKKILIVPLRAGSGIRVKTLEAMAAGKVVISTGIGIQGIEALDKIHFLRADTAREFADAVAWCLQHKEAAIRIAQNAVDLLNTNHNQKKLMLQMAEFVERLS